MLPDQISNQLTQIFGMATITTAPDLWQVETPDFRLLVLLSDDQSWLRAIISIAPAEAARPFLEQLMMANFDQTLETRYALSQNILWGVYQHSMVGLAEEDFTNALQQLLLLNQQGLDNSFNQFVEQQVRTIIRAAKQQGQSMAATLQILERFYAEGVMGNLEDDAAVREATLDAWQQQLTRLWEEEE